MGLFDLFKPAWQSSDREKAMEAIKEIDDDEMLKKIVIKASNQDVRKEAFQKMEEYLREDTVKEITDEVFLKELVLTEEDYGIRIEAVRKIKDKTFLKEVASNDTDEDVRLVAAIKLTNPQDFNCKKCGVSKANLDKQNYEKEARLKQMGTAGFINMSGRGLLKCPKCGEIACDKCALDLPGRSEKSCPFCQETYIWGSVIK